jgi:transcriptional regulator with XRE-family HTH domain
MLAENLKALRKAKGLSQEELAARLHVVRQTVSKWEKGRSVPDADLLIRLVGGHAVGEQLRPLHGVPLHLGQQILQTVAGAGGDGDDGVEIRVDLAVCGDDRQQVVLALHGVDLVDAQYAGQLLLPGGGWAPPAAGRPPHWPDSPAPPSPCSPPAGSGPCAGPAYPAG